MLIGISDLMGAQTDRLRCEVFQNLILIPINTGLLRYAVATALTAFTVLKPFNSYSVFFFCNQLQQYLPFTVLKLLNQVNLQLLIFSLQQCLPFTVLKQ